MKKIYTYPMIVFLLALVWSCSDDPVDLPDPVEGTNWIKDLRFDEVDIVENGLEINQETGTINAFIDEVPGELTPYFTLSEGAIINPGNGYAQDFSEPVNYSVVSTQGEGEKRYEVNVHLAPSIITSFQLETGGMAYEFSLADGLITQENGNYYVDFKVNYDVDLSHIKVLVAKSDVADLEPAANEYYDLREPKEFILSQNGEQIASYTVRVEQLDKIERQWVSEDTNHVGMTYYTSNTAFRVDCSKDILPLYNQMVPFKAHVYKFEVGQGYEMRSFLPEKLQSVQTSFEEFQSENPELEVIAGINGGYFGGDSSYSLVVDASEVLVQNIRTLSRSSRNYDVTRGAFGFQSNGSYEATWVYGPDNATVYSYNQPSPNIPGETPQQTPSSSFPEQARENMYVEAIGGGPVLAHQGQINLDYTAELFQSDITRYLADRTAIGVDAEGNVILLVVEGRADQSEGVSLEDLADIMVNDWNCVEAMNLDGGGSTTLIKDGALINKTSGGGSYQRAVSSAVFMVKNK